MIVRGVEIIGEGAGLREIVVSGPTITRIADSSSGERPADGPALAFDTAIAFPGLINSHDHLEFNVYPALGHKRYADYLEWGDDVHRRDRDLIATLQRLPKRDRLRWGALKNLLCGVTTVAHHGAPGDDLRSLPLGTVAATSIHSVGAARGWRWRVCAPFGRPPFVIHVGEGTSPVARREIDALVRWNLFRKPLVGVHAIAMSMDQAAQFRAVVWCPVSNEFLYGATADIAALKQRTTILFGTDSTLSAEWDLWKHLRRARELGGLGDRELFAAITREAAIAWGRLDTGRVAPGHTADLVVARKKARDPWDAFFALTPEDILLVVKDGQVVLCDLSLGTALGTARLHPSGSVVRLGATAKWVAEDVPEVLSRMREYGVESNLPIAVEPWPEKSRGGG